MTDWDEEDDRLTQHIADCVERAALAERKRCAGLVRSHRVPNNFPTEHDSRIKNDVVELLATAIEAEDKP